MVLFVGPRYGPWGVCKILRHLASRQYPQHGHRNTGQSRHAISHATPNEKGGIRRYRPVSIYKNVCLEYGPHSEGKAATEYLGNAKVRLGLPF